MEIINTPNLNEVRKKILDLKKKNKEIIVQAQDEEFNRKVLEIGINILLSPEIHNRRDKLKQRDSGLNEILCKIAAKNNTRIGIEIDKITKLDKKEKAKTLARIKQNIKLCRKAGCKIIVIDKNKYDKQGIMSFFISLGASTEQAKSEAVYISSDNLINNKKLKLA